MRFCTLVLVAAIGFSGCEQATTQGPLSEAAAESGATNNPDNGASEREADERRATEVEAASSDEAPQGADVETPVTDAPSAAPVVEETIAPEPEIIESLELNLFNPEDNLLAFTKTRGSLDPNE